MSTLPHASSSAPATTPPKREAALPLIVAGMHRSGTSLVGSLLMALGLDFGSDLVDADENNPHGYFEERAFLELHQQILARTDDEGPGHADWGWSLRESSPPAWDGATRDRARELLRSRASGSWGWKDPRTTLFLDPWTDLVEEVFGAPPRTLLVYRHPWEVADSMQRLGADVFLRHPEWALPIWCFYNRRLLDYRRRHPGTSVLVSSNALVREPQALITLLESLGLQDLKPSDLSPLVSEDLFRELPPGDPYPRLIDAIDPATLDLLEELDEAADLSGQDLWRRSKAPFSTTNPATVALSVVLPCYDHGTFVVEALASVERESTGDWEAIIVDDGSTDPTTVEILKRLETLGFHVLHTENYGLPAARNRGFEIARGAVVLPLDADNRLRPGFVPRALEILEAEPDVGVVYGDRMEFGKRREERSVGLFELERLLSGNYIDACALIRKDAWQEVGGYQEDLGAWEDWEHWISLARANWTFRYLPVLAYDYRVRPQSLVTRAEDAQTREDLVARIVARHRVLFDRHWSREPILLDWSRGLERSRDALWLRVRELESGHLDETERLQTLIAELEERSAKRESEMVELRTAHAALGETTSQLESELFERTSRLESDLSERESRLEELAQERDRAKAETVTSREEARSAIERLRVELEGARREIERLREVEATLGKISSSRSGRLLSLWWRVVARLRGR